MAERKEERKEQHSLSGPPYPDHLPGHTGEGDRGQIRVERISKLIREVESTMREQSASPTKHVGDSTFRAQDRLVNIDQEKTTKALDSNTSIDKAAKVNEWRSDSDLPLPDFLTVLPRP